MAKNIVTRAELAKFFNCSLDEITVWVNDGMPTLGADAFNVRDCQAWHRIGWWFQHQPRAKYRWMFDTDEGWLNLGKN